MIVFFLILHRVVYKFLDVSEEHIALILRVTKLVQVHAEVTKTRNYTGYVGQFEVVWPIIATECGNKG